MSDDWINGHRPVTYMECELFSDNMASTWDTKSGRAAWVAYGLPMETGERVLHTFRAGADNVAAIFGKV